jgi:hypothetical protein
LIAQDIIALDISRSRDMVAAGEDGGATDGLVRFIIRDYVDTTEKYQEAIL